MCKLIFVWLVKAAGIRVCLILKKENYGRIIIYVPYIVTYSNLDEILGE